MGLTYWSRAVAAIVAAASVSGCGLLADKDRIEIAKYNETTLTRGDFKMAIMQMAPEDKPEIRTRGDVRSALQDYIDVQIQNRLAEEMQAEGKISIPEDLVLQQYFARNEEYNYEELYNAKTPEEARMTEFDFSVMKETIEKGIEDMRKRVARAFAVQTLVQEALDNNRYEISDEEWRRQYELQRANLFEPASAEIEGLLVRADRESASIDAASIRRRLDQGESMEAIAEDMQAKGLAAPLATTLRNEMSDPYMAPFRSFWAEAADAQAGEIIGPVLVAGAARYAPDGQTVQHIPPALLVCIIRKAVPSRPYTLDEALENEDARGFLAQNIVFVKVVEELRENAAVEILDSNLPDPSIYIPTAASGPVKRPAGPGAG